jgi:hypothetical protein
MLIVAYMHVGTQMLTVKARQENMMTGQFSARSSHWLLESFPTGIMTPEDRFEASCKHRTMLLVEVALITMYGRLGEEYLAVPDPNPVEGLKLFSAQIQFLLYATRQTW